MFRILLVLANIFLFHTYAFAVDVPPPLSSPTKEAPPIAQPAKEAPPIASSSESAPLSPNAKAEVMSASQSKKDAEQHREVIEEYKKFLSKVPEDVRDEIREYRKEVIKLNRKKISLYKRLSQQAQEFLTTERNFKKRLPFRERSKVK